jgi:hypothetical protein
MTSRRANSATSQTSGSTRRKKITSAATLLPLALGIAANMGGNATTPGQSVRGGTGPIISSIFKPLCANPDFPSETATAMDGESCGLSGSGGAEANQNQAKNNFCATDPAGELANPTLTSIPELVALQTKAQQIPDINFGSRFGHPLTSKPGPVVDRGALQALGEGKLVQLIGFVKIARQEGKESVNCGTNVPDDPAYHDIHVSVVLSPADQECSGVVVEMTPHYRPEAWTAALVNEVAAAGLLVRVTGQRMFDSSHTPCQNGAAVKGDPSRISLWEVHPIYKFEVCPQGNCASGGWVALEAWKNGGENVE